MQTPDPDILALVAEELSSIISIRTHFPVLAMTVVPCRFDEHELQPGAPVWVHGIAGSELDVEWNNRRQRLPRSTLVPLPVRRPSAQRLQALDECFGAKPSKFREVASLPEHQCRVLECRKHSARFLELLRAPGEQLRLVHLGDLPDADAAMTCRRYQAMSDDMLNLLEIVALRMRLPPLPTGKLGPSSHHHFFPEECAYAFSFLADRDGFDGPEVRNLGVEQAVDFNKGPHTIHIVMEAGLPALVEVFQPTRPGGPPAVPYASLNGIQRTRRIHSLRGPAPDDGSWPYGMPGYLRALAAQFREDEAEFLDEVRG